MEKHPMKTSPRKITLSRSQDIPFNKLILSQANVRKIKAGISVEDLAEDIAPRALLRASAFARFATPTAPKPACTRFRPAAATSSW
jgi:hypothetical protein